MNQTYRGDLKFLFNNWQTKKGSDLFDWKIIFIDAVPESLI